MADEVKKYLDYEGLKHLVEKLTDRIEASGGGSGGGTAQGVYVAYVDADGVNRICDPSEWDRDNVPGKACGAVVVEGGKSLLVAPEGGLRARWATEGAQYLTDVYTTTDSNYALRDFDGKKNTEVYFNSNDDGDWETDKTVAPYKCREYSYGYVGAGKWWLPSLGEMMMIARNKGAVNIAFEACGYTDVIEVQTFWSSTQYDRWRAWAYDFDTNGLVTPDTVEDGEKWCIPVSSWVWADGGGEVTSDPEPDDWGVAPKGVYVAYVTAGGRRRLIDPSGWEASLGEAQGVLVSDGESQLLFGSEQAYLDFGDADNEYEGATVAEDEDALVADFDGMANTEAIAAVLRWDFGDDDDEHLATWCLNYATGAIGAGEWWMPSGGEANLIPRATDDELERFIDALNAIGDGNYSASAFWMCLSTLKGAGSVWGLTAGCQWVAFETYQRLVTNPVTGFSGKIVNV